MCHQLSNPSLPSLWPHSLCFSPLWLHVSSYLLNVPTVHSSSLTHSHAHTDAQLGYCRPPHQNKTRSLDPAVASSLHTVSLKKLGTMTVIAPICAPLVTTTRKCSKLKHWKNSTSAMQNCRISISHKHMVTLWFI